MQYPIQLEENIHRHLASGDLAAARVACTRLVRELRASESPATLVLMQLLHSSCERVQRELQRVFGALPLPSGVRAAELFSAAVGREQLLGLYTEYFDEMLRFARAHDAREYNLAHRARRFVDENYDTPVSTCDVARAAACSEAHLCVTFKENFGVTVGKYIRLRRIEYAKALLVGSGMPIKAVAHRVGFRSYRTFLRAFSSESERSPLAFRDAHRDAQEMHYSLGSRRRSA